MGYIMCENCGGYYKLKEGESLEDFKSCECGSPLKYVESIDEVNSKNDIKTETSDKETLEYCPDCGTPKNKDSSFCKNCGNSFISSEKISKEKSCKNCGFINDSNADFCQECGSNLNNNKDSEKCPYCNELINPRAVKCKHCGEWLDKKAEKKSKGSSVDNLLNIINWKLVIIGAASILFLIHLALAVSDLNLGGFSDFAFIVIFFMAMFVLPGIIGFLSGNKFRNGIINVVIAFFIVIIVESLYYGYDGETFIRVFLQSAVAGVIGSVIGVFINGKTKKL
ncbi:MAG: zinc ribbon domain-containing protein [Methanobacterium sp.]